MNSGSAPQTTRSWPMVSWTSIAWAIATLVPTPSVEVARSGRVYFVSAEASKSPAKPPSPPIISGRRALSIQPFISSIAVSAAWMLTPASAYALPAGDSSDTTLLGVVENGQRVAVRRRLERRLEQVLAQQALVGQRDRVLAGEAGLAQPVVRLAGRLDHALERDVAEAVGADARGDLVDVEAVGDQLRAGGEVDAVEARPLHRGAGDPDVHLEGT